MDAERKAAKQLNSTRSEQDINAIRHHLGADCKAQSAMQGPQRAPQTRSTATALVVALRGKHNLGMQLHSSGKRRARMPNPSLKLSPNGGPPGPVWLYAVHFRQSGPGVPPSVPA